MRISAAAFANYAREMLDIPRNRKKKSTEEDRIFRSCFGASMKTIATLWNELDPTEKIARRAKPEHLLWTMVALKVAKSESVHCRMTKCKD